MWSLHFLLLRSAVDVEVHGGSIEALSATDGTCCHVYFSSRRRRAERGSKFSPPLILRAAPTRGHHFPRGMAMASSLIVAPALWPQPRGTPSPSPHEDDAPGLPASCGTTAVDGWSSSAGPRLHYNSTYPSLTSSSRVWGHGFRMASLRTLGWTRASLGCASYVPALRYRNSQAGRPNIREQNM